MSGSTTISTSATKVEALSLQSSAYGVTMPLVYGVNRIAGNMVWYGGFKAIAHTSSQSSGKGGGVKTQDTSYTYSASVMMGLCEGQITGVSRAWRGKQLYSGGVTATQLITLKENYAVPFGGGSYTVAHAADYAANIMVQYTTTGGGSSGHISYPVTLSEGDDYTRVGGTYTFAAGSIGEGQTVAITYQYTIAGVSQTALQQLGLSFAAGALGQATWPYLSSTFPAQAIGYSGLALIYAQDYDLGTSASVDNHTFEVQGPQAYSISSTVADANPRSVAVDVLTNGRFGAAFPSAKMGDTAAWSDYCLASGLLMSPAITEQLQASEFLSQICKLTNTGPVWSGGLLLMVPYGDTAITGNGVTYTPNVTPVYDLTDDDFTPSSASADPIKVMRKPQSDAYNHIRIEFCNRANLYNIEIAEAKDSANIDAYGLRSADVVQAHWICDASVARSVAQLLLQRAAYIRCTYEFSLPWTKALLEPMDLVTLTDPGLGFNKLAVRITQISESDQGDLTVTAEEFPQGVAHAALYGTQSGAGFQHNYGVAPGDVLAPFIFEAPIERTLTGLEVYAAVRGTSTSWGGCRVWTSLDGVQYKDSGVIYGGARYGTLTGPIASGNLPVHINGGQITSGSATDSANLSTLCYVGGASPEYLAHATATLTGALAYTLSGLTRQAYRSNPAGAAHAAGDAFVRVDDAIAKSGALDLEMIGKTIYFKFTSFNIYGAAEQSLADVAAYTYTVLGTMANLPPPPFDVFTVFAQPDGTRQYNFSYASAAPVDWKGSEIRYVSGTVATPDWATMTPLQDTTTFYTHSPVELNAPLAGTYTFACKSLDKLENESDYLVRTITLPDRRLGNVFDEFFEHSEGWLGTLTGCQVLGGILEALDSTTWATLPSTWAAWTRWNVNPTSPISYVTPVRDFGTVIAGQVNSTLDADGAVVQELATSADGTTWSAWGSAAAPFSTRYIKLRLTVTATGPAPVPTVRKWSYQINAPIKSEYLNDIVLSSLTGAYRIGVGDIRIPLAGTYSVLKRTTVVVQDNSAGTWTYVRIDQSLSPAPRWQFRLNGVLADPAFVDFFIEGY